MKWTRKLTKKELKHIKETTTRATLTEFKRNREWQRRAEDEGCFDCRHIAQKLGLE